MKRLGEFFVAIGYLVYLGLGFWGLLLNLAVINYVAGTIGVIVGVLFFPITIAIAPWYAGFSLGKWLPFQVCYGGGILGMILVYLGMRMIHMQDKEYD